MFRFLLTKLFSKREKMQNDEVKPFLDHLEDLRGTLIKMAITVVVSMALCYVWHKQIIELLQEPIIKAGFKPETVLQLGGFTDAFMITLTISFYAGIIFSFPLLIYFLGEFVIPAMTEKEKKIAKPILTAGFLLFLGGVTFAFKVIMPAVTKFMIGTAVDLKFLQNMQAHSYFKTVSLLCIIFGLLCQVPVIMVALHGVGIITSEWIRSTRVYAHGGILTLCAIVSPTPDIPSLVLISLPIMGLYEICVWVIFVLEKRRPAETSTTPAVAATAAVAAAEPYKPYTEAEPAAPYSHDHDPYHHDDQYNDGHYHDEHYYREHPELEPESNASDKDEPKSAPTAETKPDEVKNATPPDAQTSATAEPPKSDLSGESQPPPPKE